MAVIQIPNLPLAVGLDGREDVEIVQGGTSKRTTTKAIADLGPTFIVQSTIGYFGSFYDTTDQTSAGLTSANVISFNNIGEVKGISIFDGSKIKVSENGVYNIQFAARIKGAAASNNVINIWIAKNGTNQSYTNSQMTIMSGTNDVASWNFVVNASANDYFQIYWSCATSTDITLEAYPISSNPDKPQGPSASLTIQQIGRTDAGWDEPQIAQGQVLGRAAGAASGTIEELPFSVPTDYGDFSNVITSSGSSSTANSWTPLEPYNVSLYGAVGDGLTNNSAFFTAANAAPSIVITSGTYYVGSNVTFTVPVTISSGAILLIPTGVTIAFNGGFSAGLYRVFNCSGTGAVTFSNYYMPTGYPEWWGAIKNSGNPAIAANNNTYISACITACGVTQLQLGDYWIDSTLKILDSYKSLIGMGNYFSVTGSCTRILIIGGNNITLQIGPDANPGGGANNYIRNILLENILVSRSVFPDSAGSATGILAKYVLYLRINNVRSSEHIHGFHFITTVASRITNCYSFRSNTVGDNVNSKFWAYYIDGITDVVYAGGNASLYIQNCTASTGGAGSNIINCSGFYLNGSFTDCFLINCETTATYVGININSNNPVLQNANIDLLIQSPVLDQFRFSGIYIKSTNSSGAISINGGYCAPYISSDTTSANPCVSGIYYDSSLCQTSVTDFQIIAYPNIKCRGIVAVDSANIESRTQIVNVRSIGLNYSAITLNSTTNSRFMDHVTNTAYTGVGPVVQLNNGSNRNYIQIFCNGIASAFTYGCQLVGNTNTYNEINCTGLDPSSISPANQKLTINSVNIIATGLVGTNLASGVMD
jgi:hypothetical protein